MARLTLPNVSAFADRHGKRRYRFRKKGYRSVYLPGEPGSAVFMTAYQAAFEGRIEKHGIGADRVRAGSISALINRYYQSSYFQDLAPSSQKTYRRQLENLREADGGKPVRGLERRHLQNKIDRMADRKSAANNLLDRIKVLMKLALDEGWIEHDPTQGVRGYKIRTEGFRVWTEDEIAQFERTYPSGSRERLALALLLYTGQRGSDVVPMGRQHIEGGKIVVRQQKTRERLRLPIHPYLRREIDAAPMDHLTFLTTNYGEPFSVKGFQQWFSRRVKEAGIKPIKCDDGVMRGCTAHGLRKAAATRLANAGCDDRLIMAVTGHKTSREVSRYTASRDQERAAERAFEALSDWTDSEQNLANRENGLANSASNPLKTKEA